MKPELSMTLNFHQVFLFSEENAYRNLLYKYNLITWKYLDLSYLSFFCPLQDYSFEDTQMIADPFKKSKTKKFQKTQSYPLTTWCHDQWNWLPSLFIDYVCCSFLIIMEVICSEEYFFISICHLFLFIIWTNFLEIRSFYWMWNIFMSNLDLG